MYFETAELVKLFRIFLFSIILLIGLLAVKYTIERDLLPLNSFLNLEKSKASSMVSSEFSGKLETSILNTLSDLEVRNNELESSFFLEDKEKVITAIIPKGRPIELIVLTLQKCAKGTNYYVADSYSSTKTKSSTILFKSKKKDREDIRLNIKIADRFLSNASKVAILVENFEFSADQKTVDYLSFEAPLTFSLKPSIKKSEWTAKAAAEYNKEIVIIMPMEAKFGKTSGTRLMIHYDDERLAQTINQIASTIPNFSGFVTFSPSPVLEDTRVMTTVLKQINKRYGYFIWPSKLRTLSIDKAVRNTNVAYSSIEKRITSTKADEIESQLRHCIIISQKRSKLLISVKGSKEFIKKLSELYPLFKQNGIQIVPVSQIVEQNNE